MANKRTGIYSYANITEILVIYKGLIMENQVCIKEGKLVPTGKNIGGRVPYPIIRRVKSTVYRYCRG